MSLRTLKRRVEKEIEGPSVLHGYRSMCNKLRTTYNIIASRDSVMEIPREVDPLRTSERRSRNLERIAQINLGMSMDTTN